MSYFDIKPIGLKSQVNEQEKIIQQMNDLIESIEGIETNILAGVDIFQSFANELKKIRAAFTTDKISMEQMKASLADIIVQYEQTENKLVAGDCMPPALKEMLDELKEQLNEEGNNGSGSSQDSSAYDGDPVNMSTGNYVINKEEIKLEGLFPLNFTRNYNAMDPSHSVLGNGWSHNYDIVLEVGANQLCLKCGDNKKELFKLEDKDIYRSVFGSYEWIRKTATGYSYQHPKGLCYEFDNQGYLIKQIDASGNYACFIYEEGKLTQVQNNSNGILHYIYDDKGYLSKVEDHIGGQVTLVYTGTVLTEVIGVDGSKTTYAYNEKNGIISIINPMNVKALVNEYDEKNRILAQYFPDKGKMLYAYNEEEKALIFTERNQSKCTYIHDEKLRHVATRYEDGIEKLEYNAQNKVTAFIDKGGNRTQYTYDNQGNITSVINALGQKTTYTYNAKNRLVSKKNPLGKAIVHKYDTKGHLIATINEENEEIQYEYNLFGKVNKIIGPDGSTVTLEYDEKGNTIAMTDSNHGTTCYKYDELNRVIESIDANGNKVSYEYDNKDRLIRVINALGQEKTYQYNYMGNVVAESDFDGSMRQWEYDEMNRPTVYRDKNGERTLAEYDLMGNVKEIVNAVGARTLYEYNNKNQLVKVTNPVGVVTTYEYDIQGNCIKQYIDQKEVYTASYNVLNQKIRERGLLGEDKTYEYDAVGHLIKEINVLGQQKTYEYDGCGRLVKEQDYDGSITSYGYNVLGKISMMRDKAGRETHYEYMQGGQLARLRRADGNEESYTYDAVGNLIEKTLQNGYKINYAYDELNRLIQLQSSTGQYKAMRYDALGNITAVTDGNGNMTTYTYSGQQLLEVVDPLGNKTEYTYNALDELMMMKQIGEKEEHITCYERNKRGQVEKIIDPLGHIQQFTYNALGQIHQKVDEEGHITKYTYGENGKVETIAYQDGNTVKMSYDALSNLTQYEDWLGITSINRDAYGKSVSITDYAGNQIGYEWGKMGERQAMIYPDGNKVCYEYDEALRLVALLNGEEKIAYSYDENNRLREKLYPNGLKTSYQYSEEGYLLELESQDQEGILEAYRYDYDKMGNRIAINELRRNRPEESGAYHYRYDAAHHLIGVVEPNGTMRNYEYDAFGNRKKLEENNQAIQYYYNERNQLIRKEGYEDGEFINRNYKYDLRGNLIGEYESEKQILAMTFDMRNKLSKVKAEQREETNYIYDGMGHRVVEQKGADKVCYINDFTKKYNNLLVKVEEAASQTYLWDYGIASMHTHQAEDESYYYTLDGLGSSTHVVDKSGQVVNSYGYSEFGKTVHQEQKIIQPFGFTGYQYDTANGFYFAQARYYNEGLGQFISADIIKGYIIEPKTLNEYTYCIDNPLKYVDLDGEFWTIAIGAAIGAVVNTGFEVYDQVKSGTFDITSGETWGKIGVSAAQGAIEGGIMGSGLGIVAQGGIVFAVELAGSSAKQAIDGNEIGLGENIINASINTLTTVGLSKVGDVLFKNITNKIPSFINHKEAGEVLDWLRKYAASGAPDAIEALKIIGGYGLQEALVDIVINRGNKLINDGVHSLICAA